ncbi:MAG TPA: response regulator, partial [Bacteroidales bacterium]|nr:response regulator [Bacteroidales bacterium]
TKNKTIESSNKKHSILKLLVVEDDLINVQYLKEILSRYKTCEFEFAYDGIEAIEKCRNNNYHIMLLDIQLPGMNGFEVARKIREFNKKITIIAQTAFAMAEDKTKCIAAGCNNYISKPINYLELFSMLDSYNTGSQ